MTRPSTISTHLAASLLEVLMEMPVLPGVKSLLTLTVDGVRTEVEPFLERTPPRLTDLPHMPLVGLPNHLSVVEWLRDALCSYHTQLVYRTRFLCMLTHTVLSLRTTLMQN